MRTIILSHFYKLRDDGVIRCCYPVADVYIGTHVFTGANVIIANSVTIGDWAVIAAGSVVTCNIPSNEVWGGSPAHFIKVRP